MIYLSYKLYKKENNVKPILHFQLPLDKNGDMTSMKKDEMGNFMRLLNEKIGDKYILVMSTCIPSMLGKDSKVFNFKMDQISTSELEKIINGQT